MFSCVMCAQDKPDFLSAFLRSHPGGDTLRVNALNGLSWKLKNSKPDTAMLLSREALSIAEKLSWEKGIARSLNNLGVYASEKKDYSEALHYYLQALKVVTASGDNSEIALHTGNLGALYRRIKEFDAAEKYLLRAEALDDSTASLRQKKVDDDELSKLYAETGKYQLALVYFKKFIVLRDSIYSDESTKKSVQASMQYEFEKKTTADSIRIAGKEKQEELKHLQKIKHQKLFTYGGLLGVFLMIIVALVSFRAFRQKQKINAIISSQKQLVEEKQKEVLDSIQYARRIQRALLPTDLYIGRHLKKIKKT